jgi:putative transposon-encoded protein
MAGRKDNSGLRPPNENFRGNENAVTDVKEKNGPDVAPGMNVKVKFEVYGEEMIEKKVKLSGNSGRVYLPPDWVDHHVKIIRID